MKLEKINKEIKEILNLDIFKIKKTDLKSLSNWDSLKYIDLVSCIEAFTKKRLSPLEIRNITNSDYLKKLIEKNAKK